MAAGGQGAPLVPLVDYLLFRSDRYGRVMLNLGGIANVTVLPPGCGPEDVIAFDTGPGNMVIDAVTAAVTRGAQSQDTRGELAAKGKVSGELLDRLMAHAYLAEPPPKSTGRETFGAAFVRETLEAGQGLSFHDLVRTVTAYTAESVCNALHRFVFPACAVDEVVVSGGGAENPVLIGTLSEKLSALRVGRIDTLGIPSEAKEAVAFAVLANEALAGRTGSLVQVTGAERPVILGAIVPGRGFRFRVDPGDPFS
jgi:anhydro-N-acetylmuramic acid kinase